MAVPPRPSRGRKNHATWARPQQIVGGRDFRLVDEVRYVQRWAADHHGRIVTIGQLILFSTETGDAWLLDPTDQLAARLARGGASEPIPRSPSVGGGAIASRDPPLSIQTTRAARRRRSSVTRPISSLTSVEP